MNKQTTSAFEVELRELMKKHNVKVETSTTFDGSEVFYNFVGGDVYLSMEDLEKHNSRCVAPNRDGTRSCAKNQKGVNR